jgi:hypothetical protein
MPRALGPRKIGKYPIEFKANSIGSMPGVRCRQELLVPLLLGIVPATEFRSHAHQSVQLGMHALGASSRAYFSKPRMYGMTGGRGPVSKSGPRVER